MGIRWLYFYLAAQQQLLLTVVVVLVVCTTVSCTTVVVLRIVIARLSLSVSVCSLCSLLPTQNKAMAHPTCVHEGCSKVLGCSEKHAGGGLSLLFFNATQMHTWPKLNNSRLRSIICRTAAIQQPGERCSRYTTGL